MKKKVIYGALLLLIAIQLVRPEKNQGLADTPNDITHHVDVPESTLKILKTSCYDCHSNHTNYPLYSEIMPFGWFLADHVKDGKKHLNFSDFSKYTKKKIDHKLEETAEEVEKHDMPLSTYLIMHSKAKLTESQTQEIIEWVNRERAKLQASGL